MELHHGAEIDLHLHGVQGPAAAGAEQDLLHTTARLEFRLGWVRLGWGWGWGWGCVVLGWVGVGWGWVN